MLTWADIGILASAASAFAAALALAFNAAMIVQQRKANDATTLFAVITSIREGESRLAEAASDPARFTTELNHYLNLLETFAAAVNHGLFGKATRRIATDRLVTDLAMLLSDAATSCHIEQAVTSGETFCELLRFQNRNKKAICGAVNAFAGNQQQQ